MFQSLPAFTENLLSELKELSIDFSELQIDHIAYRALPGDLESSENELKKRGICIDTTMISGRPICVYELYEPIQFADQQISIVEFMYPKEGATKGGWDHIEVVLGEYTPDLKEIEKRITGLSGPILTGDNARYDAKRNEGIVSGQRPNPAITLQFQESAIRFHSISLKELLTH